MNTFFQLDAVEMINVVKTIDGTGFYDYSKHEISDASKQKIKGKMKERLDNTRRVTQSMQLLVGLNKRI